MEGFLVRLERDLASGRREVVKIDRLRKVDILEGEGDEGVSLDEILSKAIEEPPTFVLNRSVYFLTPDEVEGLRKEVESEVDPTFVFNITDILFEILALEKEREPYQDAANLLIKILDALITLGEYQKASDLLKRVYIILKTYQLNEWQKEMVQKFILGAGENQRVELIGKILEREEGIRLEEVNNFLVLLQRNSIQPLIKLLGELKNSKTRRVLCDSLSEIGKNAIEIIAPFIDDNFFYLTGLEQGMFEGACAVLYIDGSLDILVSELEAESARKSTANLFIYKTKKEFSCDCEFFHFTLNHVHISLLLKCAWINKRINKYEKMILHGIKK
jgi:hypothetical protein